MSWPQNPNDPQQPRQQPNPAQGYGPPPNWGPAGGQPPAAGPAPAGPYAAQPYGQQPPPPPGGFAAPPPPPGMPGPPQTPPPGPQGSRKGLYAAIGAVAAVALVGGGVAYAVMGGGSKKDNAGSSPSASASQPAAPPATDGPNAATGTDKPLIAGWQTQANATNGFAYDVPPTAQSWKVAPTKNIVSYVDDSGQPIVAMEGTSVYREGGCPSRANPNAFGTAGTGQLATIGTQGGQGDLGENAQNVAGNWAFASYGGKEHKPHIRMSKPMPWKHNGIDGYTATADVTLTYHPSGCVPARAVARGIAYKGKDGVVHCWVIYADQGVPNALTAAEIDKIMSTVRPYGGQ